jgi:hypothetical protein
VIYPAYLSGFAYIAKRELHRGNNNYGRSERNDRIIARDPANRTALIIR